MVVTNGTVCSNANNGSISISASGGIGTKTYSDNNGVTYSGASLFSGLAVGTYTVKVKDANTCLSAALSYVITRNSAVLVNTPIVVNATTCTAPNGKITVLATGGDGFYNYSDNCGSTWQSSNIFTALLHAAYHIEVKDAAGCTSSTNHCATATVASATGSCGSKLEDNGASSNSAAFNVYPNPANTEVTIAFTANKEEAYTIRLIDITGRVVINQNETSIIGDNQYLLNISALSRGIYMVVLLKSDGTLQKKIVVQ
jgi:hypothetical protein